MTMGIVLAGAQVSFADNSIELSSDLSFGRKGEQVTALQDFLRGKGYFTASSTGYFGKITENAVIQYQKEKKLNSVGFVGPLTRKAINEEIKNLAIVKEDDGHNVKNSLDVDGVYTGVLPCASCEGIETSINLTNGKYTLVEKYLKRKVLVSTTTGAFIWKDNTTIALGAEATGTPSVLYAVTENKLTRLDMEGNQVTGTTAPFYVLNKVVKVVSPVEDKKWKMVELNGKEISGTVEDYYVIFHSKDTRLETKAGCNQMGGKYTLDGYAFKSSEVFSTMMACENMDDEQAFSKVLETADNISYSETSLSFNKARMAPLARFELVK